MVGIKKNVGVSDYKVNVKGVEDFEINVLALFLHEQAEYGPFCEYWIAEEVAGSLRTTIDPAYELDVRSPSDCGLDRFVLEFEDQSYATKCHTPKELQALWPVDIFQALRGVGCLRWL